jgi:hypothetical protein
MPGFRPKTLALFGCSASVALLFAEPARAICKDLCDITVQKPIVQPKLDCLEVTPLEEGCGCSVGMSVRNTCETNLETVGEEFDGCCSIREDLPTVYANERNVILPS